MPRQTNGNGNVVVEPASIDNDVDRRNRELADAANAIGDPINGTVIINPGDIGRDARADDSGTDDDAGSPRRRRGRPRGSRNRAASKETGTLDGGTIEALLLSIHMMLHAMTGVQELALSPMEAKQLSEAFERVSRHYDVSTSVKTLDWTNAMATVAMVYGTRLFAFRRRLKSMPRDQGNGMQMPGGGPVIIPGVGPAPIH